VTGPVLLTLDGTIEALDPIAQARRRHGWRVTLAVDRVVDGIFSGDRFQFVVHSPARSGLQLGGRATVKAERTADGYSVDPDQWLPRI
jgi:hypothetical protein